MRSPKLARNRSKDWYRYYAGYAPEFVEDALETLGVSAEDHVLDPWNGSGTTTAVAQTRGIQAVGYDANPALVLIARSRLLGSEVADSVASLADDLVDHAGLYEIDDRAPDPLSVWFATDAVREVRGLERAIRHVLVSQKAPAMPKENGAIERVSALAAFFYVALFEVVRSSMRPYVTSNPTWIKKGDPSTLISFEPGAIHDSFRKVSERMTRRLRDRAPMDGKVVGAVALANSCALPLEDDSIAGAITSPPYCTRIDYVAATRPELAVIGFSDDEIRVLRNGMIGTPTIANSTPPAVGDWGEATTDLLAQITAHRSHASGTYYRKYYLQYFDSLWKSLEELRRVIVSDGKAIIVVQDSFYKELHVDLAGIVQQMSERLGFTLAAREDFDITTTKAAIHPGSRSWRSKFSATESALVFS
ncbi:MAG: hypothetical protein ACJ757_08565 [Gaiellaceae bacterium]